MNETNNNQPAGTQADARPADLERQHGSEESAAWQAASDRALVNDPAWAEPPAAKRTMADWLEGDEEDLFYRAPPAAARDQLNESCPAGWYECTWTGGQRLWAYVLWWTGTALMETPSGDTVAATEYEDFRGPLVHAPSLERQYSETLDALEKEAKHSGVGWQRIADAIGLCKRGTHSGTNPAAHHAFNDVLKILEGCRND